MSKSSRFWCFTLNNPEERDWDAEAAAALISAGGTKEEIERVRAPYPRILFSPETMSYLVYQSEKGANGTEHYQGYVEFHKKVTLNKAKTFLQDTRMHLEIRGQYSSAGLASAYCMKEEGRLDGPWEYGEISKGK